MSYVIEATAISVAAHSRGVMLAVLAGPTVAANIRLSESLVQQLSRSLRTALEAQRVLEQQESTGARG
jgi:hypothetical protein